MSSRKDRRAGGVQAAIHGARSTRAAAAVAACLLLSAFAPVAFAQQAECGYVRWDAATGPVASYDVYVEIENNAFQLYAQDVEETEILVSGSQFGVGDALRFQVVARGDDGTTGPPSEVSDVIFCGNVPTPEGLLAEDGSARDPIVLTWDPVEHADFYVIFRSTQPGVDGEYVDRSDEPFFEDAEAALAVQYYYSVSAVAGIQISEFSEQAEARRGAVYPTLVASRSELLFQPAFGESTARMSFDLRNVGDWALAYQAWPGASWLKVSPSAGLIEDEVVRVDVTLQLTSLAPGMHQAVIPIYTYYDPPAGEEFDVGQSLDIVVRVEVLPANRPPVIESSLVVNVAEGQTLVVSQLASDPDGDQVTLAATGLPTWASFQAQSGGTGLLTVSPGLTDAGTWTAYIHAVDDAVPEAFTSRELTIVVSEAGSPPVVVQANQPPVLAPIADRVLAVGSKTVIQVSAFDPDLGDRLAFITSSLPDFVRLVDRGNGTADFQLAPKAEDVGNYLLIVLVVDDGDPPLSRGLAFQVTVTAN